MDTLLQLIWSLVQPMPMVLSVLASLFTGYVLKLIPKYSNQRIPLAAIGVSVLAYLILCVPPASAHDNVISFVRYVIATLILGCVIGMFAWLFHAALLKQIETKIPFLGDALKNADNNKNTDTNTKP